MKLLCINLNFRIWSVAFCLFIHHSAYATNKANPCLPFHRGEKLNYQVYYSFSALENITLGEIMMHVDEKIHYINNRPCYKIQAKGISNKKLELIGKKIEDTMQSYLDMDFLRPNKSIIQIHENDYLKKEAIDFDYKNNLAKVKTFENKPKCHTTVNDIPICHTIQDVLSVYYSLRHIDTKKLKNGDQLKINVLHDQQIYKGTAVKFAGIKTITTKLGKISSLIFIPILSNDFFSGQQPIEIFISNDSNKIPLKIHCNLASFGKLSIELTHYQGLNEKLVFCKP